MLPDHVELGQPVEHHVAALDATVGVGDRVVARRVLDQAGQGGALEEGEVLGVGVEVVPRRRLYAVRPVAVVGDVEVALEDPVLGVVLLEGDRVAQLGELAGVGVGGRRLALLGGLRLVDQRHLDHLLGDRRATLDRPAAGLVGDQGPERALQVERTVLVVAVVLDGHDRLDHLPRDLAQRDVDAVLVVEGGDGGARPVHDLGLLGQRLRAQVGREVLDGVGQRLGPDPENAGERDRETGDHDAHDGRDDRHHAEMGGDTSGGEALTGGHGHAVQST